MRKHCFCDRENLLKFKAEGREFAKILRLLEQFIQTVKGQNYFLTCSWRFLISNKLCRTIGIQIGKNDWESRNMQEKLQNILTSFFFPLQKTKIQKLNLGLLMNT